MLVNYHLLTGIGVGKNRDPGNEAGNTFEILNKKKLKDNPSFSLLLRH